MTMSIEEFKEIYKTSTQQTDASEEQAEETIEKKSTIQTVHIWSFPKSAI